MASLPWKSSGGADTHAVDQAITINLRPLMESHRRSPQGRLYGRGYLILYRATSAKNIGQSDPMPCLA